MPKTVRSLVMICTLMAGILALAGTANANWSETFGGNKTDLNWQWYCQPDLTKTFTYTIKDGPGDNDYISIDETTPASVGGSQFGMGFGSAEQFTDVRVGTVVNVTGDALYRNQGMGARVSYFINPGSPPGLVASGYVMHINWEYGPANLVIDIEKVVNLENIMRESFYILAPGYIHARSYYAELDVIGSGPVYVTGSLYEYNGGPLVVRTNTMVDTAANDPWEEEGARDAPFTKGVSGIFAQNDRHDPGDPVGYHVTFDSVSCVSDGPAAVNPYPADAAVGVRTTGTPLRWQEAAFATSRELWIGKPGAMQKVSPNPTGPSYDLGLLACAQPYQWRVDQIGPSGTVQGRLWSFTTAECLTVDDIEDYTDTSPHRIYETWVDGYQSQDNGSIVGYPDPNFAGGEHFVETTIVHGGTQSMPFFYDNTAAKNYSEAVADTSKLAIGSDWTKAGAKAFVMYFRGNRQNTDAPIYVRLEDSGARSATVVHPVPYAVQAEGWYQWDIDLKAFSDATVDLTNVKKVCIGFGDKTGATTNDGKGLVFLDDIALCPPRCFNKGMLDLSGDVNGDCIVDLKDFADMADGWLNNGLSVLP